MRPTIFLAAFLAATYLIPAPVVIAGTTSVDIHLFQFKPKALDIEKGDTVIWMNGDAIEHSVTSGSPGKPSEAFDSGFFIKGGSFRHTFDKAGTFIYFCKRHPNMQATVNVLP
jgi:plastocyanin